MEQKLSPSSDALKPVAPTIAAAPVAGLTVYTVSAGGRTTAQRRPEVGLNDSPEYWRPGVAPTNTVSPVTGLRRYNLPEPVAPKSVSPALKAMARMSPRGILAERTAAPESALIR